MSGMLVLLACIGLSLHQILIWERAGKLMEAIRKSRSDYGGRAQAKIIEVPERRLARSIAYYYPVFCYIVDEKAYGESSLLYSSREGEFRTGESCMVRYNEKKPQEFMPEEDESLWEMADSEKKNALFMVCILMALGTVAAAFPGAGFP